MTQNIQNTESRTTIKVYNPQMLDTDMAHELGALLEENGVTATKDLVLKLVYYVCGQVDASDNLLMGMKR